MSQANDTQEDSQSRDKRLSRVVPTAVPDSQDSLGIDPERLLHLASLETQHDNMVVCTKSALEAVQGVQADVKGLRTHFPGMLRQLQRDTEQLVGQIRIAARDRVETACRSQKHTEADLSVARDQLRVAVEDVSRFKSGINKAEQHSLQLQRKVSGNDLFVMY